ncbi:ABC transporter permease subunit [Cytobacillus firmus]|uniref:ABC transporter permease subunit n=1 Tax=Cytobacillus firmus TaxID=1399 RepID=UPI0024C1BFBD|nr:ABC transporter permease subunit [Cytobacillus firmus]WHY59862.1 ABC transporter permease subunit [Cytobacillus firmus]
MKFVSFELKKLMRQKKFFWLFFIVILFTCTIFLFNYLNYSQMKDRAYIEVQKLEEETRSLQTQIIEDTKTNPKDKKNAEQLSLTQNMLGSIFEWKVSISEKEWNTIPEHEGKFLSHLYQFIINGGQFKDVQLEELEVKINKNAWIQKHNLSYEDEEYPLSPHLIIKESTLVFLGISGLVLLILFFGSSISMEKEQNTWSTLVSQPISKSQLLIGKYISQLLSSIVLILVVIGFGILIPLLFQQQPLSIHYPQLVGEGNNVTFIPIYIFIARAIMFFICANAILFSLISLISMLTNNTFISLILTSFLLLFGYIFTDLINILQEPYNPFHFFQLSNLVMTIPSKGDFLYIIGAITWSSGLLIWTILISKKDMKQKVSVIHSPFNGGKTQLYSKQLLNFINFEWRKLIRKGLLFQVLSVFTVFIILGSFLLTHATNEKRENYISELEERAKDYEAERIPSLKEMVNSNVTEQSHGEFSQELNTILQNEEERLKKIKKSIEGYSKDNLKPLLDYQLFELQAANGEFDSSRFIQSQVKQLGQFTIDASLAEKRWLIDNQVDPVFSGIYNPTIFMNWTFEQKEQTKEEWIEQNKKIDNSGLFSLYYYLEQNFYYVMVVFVFLLGSGFTIERNKRYTINFLRTQPISAKHIYLGKIISSSIIFFLSWTILLFIILLVGTIAGGIGNWYYPVIYYDSVAEVISSNYSGHSPVGWNTGFHLDTMGNYVMSNYLLISLVFVFLIVLSIFISLFLKNTFSVFAVSGIITVLGLVFSSKMMPSIAHLLPFIYLTPTKIINGEISVKLNNPYVDLTTGILILTTSTLLIVLLGYLILKKKTNIKTKLTKSDSNSQNNKIGRSIIKR